MMKKSTMTALCLVLALLISLCGCSGEKEEAYRMIQVLEASGNVSVERASMGAMDAYAGMRLESGDKITVAGDSWLKIKMDDDKYALVEPNSTLRLEASGSSADSKTVLHLEAGAVSNRLEKELSENASYEVKTPNSTMAVRGTVFRVELSWNQDGVSVSNISVYNGQVSSRLVYPDGSVDGEDRAVLIAAGTQVRVWGNDVLSRYETTDGKLTLDELRLNTLKFLQEAVESGDDLNLSQEELKELIDALKQEPESDKETTEPEKETTSPTQAPSVPTTAPTTPTTPRPTTPPATTKATEPPEPDPPATTQSPETEATTAPTTEPTTPSAYTVTFQYNGAPFATQTVQTNAVAAAPKLQPTATGSWNFDFTTPITQDTVIVWSAG